ncbi:MAG TPA: amidohydrolase family protein, partial [Rectinemataceae bacterium]
MSTIGTGAGEGEPRLWDIVIGDGRILSIQPAGGRSPGEDCFDARGAWVVSGFIDMHTHGGAGADVMDEDPGALAAIAEHQLACGVTSFLATTLSAPLGDIAAALGRVRAHIAKEALGARKPVAERCSRPASPRRARIAGAHLEGPFLSASNAGAQNRASLRAPEGEAADLVIKNADIIRRITLAPELPGATAFIRRVRKAGIGVSAGHDGAIDEEIEAAVEAGLDCVTHLFCCSSTISRRDGPRKHLGLTEFGLADGRLSVEIIADGLHVPDRLLGMVLRAKGADRVCLVSDSIRVAGLPDGEYRLGDSATGTLVIKRGTEVFVPGVNLYAGSATDLGTMVRRLVANGVVSLAQAVSMATEV